MSIIKRARKGKYAKHGMSGTREYYSYRAMLSRCNNPKDSMYYNYGGRGITVCDRWNDKENGIKHFISDMGYMPTSKHQIERLDVNKGYCPSNCVWATQAEQSRNKRSNVLLTHNGKTMCVSDWAVIIGIDQSSLRKRLKKGTPIDFEMSKDKWQRYKK